MARAILLILLIAATASLYQAKRAQRLEAALDRRAAESTAGTNPSEVADTPVAHRGPARSSANSSRTRILPPLDLDQREGLRDALEDWGAVPEELLTAEVDRAGRRDIAIAAFRALLAERAREVAAASRLASARRLSLDSGEDLLLLDLERTRDLWSGTTLDGEQVRVPVGAVRTNDPAPAEEVRVARRALRTTEAARAVADGEAGTLTRLLIDALADADLEDADLEDAEEWFAVWILGHGPALIADEISDPERRATHRALARALRGPHGAVAAHSAGAAGETSEASKGEERSVAALERFLETRKRMRELSEEERAAALLECNQWEEWLGDRIAERGETAGDLPRLLRDLRQLRFDLVKTSGF